MTAVGSGFPIPFGYADEAVPVRKVDASANSHYQYSLMPSLVHSFLDSPFVKRPLYEGNLGIRTFRLLTLPILLRYLATLSSQPDFAQCLANFQDPEGISWCRSVLS